MSEWGQKQAKKQSKGPRIKRGARFKVKRGKLKLAIKADQRPEAWGIIEQYTQREDPAFARWRTEDQILECEVTETKDLPISRSIR